MSGIAERIQAEEDVIKAVLDLLLTERTLGDDEESATALLNGQDGLAVAAERLTRAVDALPMGKRPKGWGG